MTTTEYSNLATKITGIKELIQSQDALREKASVERHKHINKSLVDQDDRINANTRWRHILIGVYMGSATVMGTIWTIFTFFIE